jgi:hypothetical protein
LNELIAIDVQCHCGIVSPSSSSSNVINGIIPFDGTNGSVGQPSDLGQCLLLQQWMVPEIF